MRFKISDRMLAALSGLLIIALGLAIALVGSGLLPNVDVAKLLYGPYELWQRIVICVVALVLVLLGLHGLHMLFRRRNEKGFIVQRTDMGDMSIAIHALSSMVNKCIAQHKEIVVKKIQIDCVRGGIIVNLKLLLANGINHPCREMHGMFAELLYETIFGAISTMPEPDVVPAPEPAPEQGDEITPLEFEDEAKQDAPIGVQN